MNHLELAMRNLKRRPARSLLTVIGVALAVGSFITLYGLSRSVQENVQQSFEERGTDLTVRRRGIAEPFGGNISEAVIAEIAKIPGVEAVSGQLLSFAATDNDDHVLAFGWGAGSFYWPEAPLLEGRIPATVYLPEPGGSAGAREVLLDPPPREERPPAIVVMHGFAGDRASMSGLSRRLAESGYAVLAFDAMGHGANRNPFLRTRAAGDAFSDARRYRRRGVAPAALPLPDHQPNPVGQTRPRRA